MEELEEIKVTTTYRSQVMRGIELLELCQKLQSEKDGVDRPYPLSIVKSKKLDQFALDVENAIVWMSSILKLYPQSQKLAALGKELEAQGKIKLEAGDSYSEVALDYLCHQHGVA